MSRSADEPVEVALSSRVVRVARNERWPKQVEDAFGPGGDRGLLTGGCERVEGRCNGGPGTCGVRPRASAVVIEAEPALRGVRFADPIEDAVWYGVAEALTNVLKHADARRVVVALAQRDGRLVAEVGDDGRGFNAAEAAGFGLAGLTDRVAALGGQFTVDSSPGEGTRVRIDLPLRETPAPAGVR